MKSHINPPTTKLTDLTKHLLQSLPFIPALLRPEVLEALSADISESEMEWGINKLNDKARPGDDGVPSSFYKHLDRESVLRLARDLTSNLRDPSKDPWNFRVTDPVYKAGDPSDLKTLRPITLPPADQKLLWIIIFRRIGPHIFDPLIIPPSMWGFLPGRSTREISCLIEDFLDHALTGEGVDPVNTIMTALDLKGAFDKVSHLLVETVWKRLGLPFWGLPRLSPPWSVPEIQNGIWLDARYPCHQRSSPRRNRRAHPLSSSNPTPETLHSEALP